MDIIKIKKIIKESPLEAVIRTCMIPCFWLNSKIINVQAWMRHICLSNPAKFHVIKDLKNSHLGERCFVVATGPSLTFEDLHSIKDEFSFSLNSSVKILDKTDWTPNIYGIQDEYVYQSVEKDILRHAKSRLKGKIIVADYLANICKSARHFPQFPLNMLDRKYNHRRTGVIKFSEDSFKIVYDGYSIVFSMLQLAIYMGFKEIYLMGCDCTYKGDKNDYFADHGIHDPAADIAGLRLIYVHSKFKEFADAHGVKVYNCTRGGMLEEYPRKTLEEVLGK